MIINFLDMLCVLVVIGLVVIAYVMHLEQKVDKNEFYSYKEAVIDDFKFISIGIIVLVAMVMAIRGIVVLVRMFC